MQNFKHDCFVAKSLDPKLPAKQLYQNLRGFGLMKTSNQSQTEIDVDRMNKYFLKKPNRNSDLDFAIPSALNVPEFSIVHVSEAETSAAIRSIKSNAAGCDEVPLSIIKMILPVILPSITHIFNHIFTC
jgi:hypothetical protein